MVATAGDILKARGHTPPQASTITPRPSSRLPATPFPKVWCPGTDLVDVWADIFRLENRFEASVNHIMLAVVAPGACDHLVQAAVGTRERSQPLPRVEVVRDRGQGARQRKARQAFEDHETTLVGAAFSASDLHAGVILIRDELGEPALAALVRRFAITARWRLRRLLRYNAAPDTPALALPAAELGAASAELESRATALFSDDQSEARLALKREHQELQDRKWLAGIKDDVLAEIERKTQLARLRTALRDTVHTQISNKNSALSDTLVTNRLRGRFAQEIARMSIAGLAIELCKTRTHHGVPQFHVSLIHKPDAKAGQVLSEGEHRCFALAAFLAELSTTDSQSGIVFDDPVSSLDHLHREQITGRSRRHMLSDSPSPPSSCRRRNRK